MSAEFFCYNIIVLIHQEGQKSFIRRFECDIKFDLSNSSPDDEFDELIDEQVKFELEGSFGIVDFEYEIVDIRQIEE